MADQIRILVVDDQETMRIYMTRVLDTLGYSCDMATNGRECLDLCATNPYDLIFLDLVMPILDGELCLKEIRANHPQTKVVIISVNDDEDSVTDLLHQGATAYLCKPFSLENVRDVMQKLDVNSKQAG